jgi:hypothetical protein
VIEDENPEDLASRDEALRDVNLVNRWGRVARWMIVALMFRRSLCGRMGGDRLVISINPKKGGT